MTSIPLQHFLNDRFGDQLAPDGSRVQENFAAWFDQSKAIDAEGKPLIAFHATTQTAPIDSFNRRYKPDVKKGADSIDSIGTWFTDNPNRISDYGIAAYPAYLRILKPLILESFDDLRDLWGQMQTEGKRNKAYYARRALYNQNPHWGNSDELVDELQCDGYDGIILRRNGKGEWADQTALIVFEPHQIKSAIGNSGLFRLSDSHLCDRNPDLDLALAAKNRIAVEVNLPQQSERHKKNGFAP